MEKIVTLPGTLPGLLNAYAPVVHCRMRFTDDTGTRARGVVYCINDEDECLVAGRLGGRFACSELELDLSTPEGMARASRWLAERLDMNPGATAPLWIREPYVEEWIWILQSPLPERCYHMCQFGSRSAHERNEYIMYVPGIEDMTDAAESLAAACLKVGHESGRCN